MHRAATMEAKILRWYFPTAPSDDDEQKFQFQDGSILPVKGTFKSMVDTCSTSKSGTSMAKLLNQSGTVLDVAAQPFKVLKSPHRTLLRNSTEIACWPSAGTTCHGTVRQLQP